MSLIPTAQQTNLVVVLINVPWIVLENCVSMIPTAHQVNIVVVLMEHAP